MGYYITANCWEPEAVLQVAWVLPKKQGGYEPPWSEVIHNTDGLSVGLHVPDCPTGEEWELRIRSGRLHPDGEGMKIDTVDINQDELANNLPMRLRTTPWMVRVTEDN